MAPRNSTIVSTFRVKLFDVLTDLWPQDPLYGFYCRQFNPDATTPPQVIGTVPVSRELRLARQNQLHRCITLADAVTWICLVFSIPAYSLIYGPKVERH